MATPPHLSPKLVVGVGSLLLTVVATWATMRTSGYPEASLPSWPKFLGSRLRSELPRGDHLTVAWVAVAVWSAVVSGLHFGGVYYNVYTTMPWWDLMTHAMGGLGVAALLAFTFRGPTLRSPLWLVPAVLAIGAGFEIYEFLFKTFWYNWSLEFYVEDTIVDLVLNTTGAAAFATATAAYRSRVRSGSAATGHEDEPVGADTD
ncbi:hypothetical protein [Halobellus rarus]|uniref:Integral membrane protein n=1 Tax=Halobellus rarus TaxID=1126237 RepID=A0ABD6CQY1_9EURY|nr:hypothetical protein [Halobellus rarus]